MKPSELLSDESKWTKFYFAKLPNGNGVHWSNRMAKCFCLAGALSRCGKSDAVNLNRVYTVLQKLYPQHASLVDFNDHPATTFADIKAVLREAGL